MSDVEHRQVIASSPGLPALAGGSPQRSEFLPFARVQISPEAEAAVVAALRSGWISQGPVTARFEDAFAATVGAAHGVGVSSCTAGLHLLLRAAGVGAGDEVITSAMTFPATANAILHAGAVPVLADVSPSSLSIDPASVAAAITPRTRAIVAVHFAGWPADMDPLRDIARGAGLTLLEDAAHALGGSYRGRSAGVLGDGAAFSFYATKNLTTGDGGMITTDRGDWVERLRVERLHGIDVDASRRVGTNYRHWEAVSLGWKYNMTDIAASLGLAQMGGLGEAIRRRQALDSRYRQALSDCDAVEMLDGPPGSATSAHLFVLRLRPGLLRIDRDTLLQALLAENIGVGVHFRALPCHRFFRDEIGLDGRRVPAAMEASERVFSIPLDAGLSDREQDDVIAALLRILRHYRR